MRTKSNIITNYTIAKGSTIVNTIKKESRTTALGYENYTYPWPLLRRDWDDQTITPSFPTTRTRISIGVDGRLGAAIVSGSTVELKTIIEYDTTIQTDVVYSGTSPTVHDVLVSPEYSTIQAWVCGEDGGAIWIADTDYDGATINQQTLGGSGYTWSRLSPALDESFDTIPSLIAANAQGLAYYCPICGDFTEFTLTNASGNVKPSIVTSTAGSVHLAWVKSGTLYYTYGCCGDFVEPIEVSDFGTVVGDECDIQIAGKGLIAITAGSTTPYKIALTKDNGVTWTIIDRYSGLSDPNRALLTADPYGSYRILHYMPNGDLFAATEMIEFRVWEDGFSWIEQMPYQYAFSLTPGDYDCVLNLQPSGNIIKAVQDLNTGNVTRIIRYDFNSF